MGDSMPAVLQGVLGRVHYTTRGTIDYCDPNFQPEHLTREVLQWAVTVGIKNKNSDIREESAIIAARSDAPLLPHECAALLAPIRSDHNPFVRCWLACALYKRGYRHPDVGRMWHKACAYTNLPLGDFAKQLATN